jgi:hypothetical protein
MMSSSIAEAAGISLRVCIVLLYATGPVSADMYSVANVAELISAIHAANQNGRPDTIALSPGATFTLTEVNSTMHGATGLPTIVDSAELAILGNGSIIERSATGGTPAFRLFDVAAGAALALDNVTLQGGLTGFESFTYGGAIYNAGNLALNGVTVRNSVARGRVGANCFRCRPGGNGGPGWPGFGGGIFSEGSLHLENSEFVSNHAQGGSGGFGSPGGNRGRGGDGRGGGVYVAAGTATFTNSDVSGNNSEGGVGSPSGSGYAGGIYIANAQVGLDEFTVDHIAANSSSTSFPNIYGTFDIIPDLNPLPGDFHRDGTVDAADYVVWRKGLGSDFTPDDFHVWRAHFGLTGGSGALARAAGPAVPEPVTMRLTLMAAAACVVIRFGGRDRRCRRNDNWRYRLVIVVKGDPRVPYKMDEE